MQRVDVEVTVFTSGEFMKVLSAIFLIFVTTLAQAQMLYVKSIDLLAVQRICVEVEEKLEEVACLRSGIFNVRSGMSLAKTVLDSCHYYSNIEVEGTCLVEAKSMLPRTQEAAVDSCISRNLGNAAVTVSCIRGYLESLPVRNTNQ